MAQAKNNSRTGEVIIFQETITNNLPWVDPYVDPFVCLDNLEDVPRFNFFWDVKKKQDGSVKKRLVGKQNEAMQKLHLTFIRFLQNACKATNEKVFMNLPSATAFISGRGSFFHANIQKSRNYFYITDLENAYESIDTDMLIILIVVILRYQEYKYEFGQFVHELRFGYRNEKESLAKVYDDPLTICVREFVNTFCRGPSGRGLIVGASSSPYLFNLYCEIMLDAPLRNFCRPLLISYARFADDLSFSSFRPVFSWDRKVIRQHIVAAGFEVSHPKSKVLYVNQGPVPMTGFKIRQDTKILFPGKKRRKLRNMLHVALRRGGINQNVLNGHIAHFKDYLNRIYARDRTNSDRELVQMIHLLKKRGQANST